MPLKGRPRLLSLSRTTAPAVVSTPKSPSTSTRHKCAFIHSRTTLGGGTTTQQELRILQLHTSHPSSAIRNFSSSSSEHNNVPISAQQPTLSHYRAIITGASRGIGLSIAQHFARAGARCLLIARNEGLLRDAVVGLPSPTSSEHHKYLVGDVRSKEFWGEVVKSVRAEDAEGVKGTILVNAAGVTHYSLLVATPEDVIADVLETNLLGTVVGCKAVVRGVMMRGGGRGKSQKVCEDGGKDGEDGDGVGPGNSIINISSVLGMKGGRGSSVYAASKAGVIGFTRALATELPPTIRANSISPGYISTSMLSTLSPSLLSSILNPTTTPSSRLGTVEEVASAAMLLALNKFMNGANLVVDGGVSAT